MSDHNEAHASALRYVKEAWITGIIFGAFNLIFVIVATIEGDLSRLPGLFDSAICFALSYAIHSKSRVAAILLFLYCTAVIVSTITRPTSAVGFMTFVLAFVAFRGILGTFRYHKLQSGQAQV